MDSLLYIPKKLKVGYQERKDTYTQKLAYVIYYDHTGKLRKETSWKSWIDKGSDGREWCTETRQYITKPEKIRGPLPTHEFENIPTEGFVLNRSGGGAREGRYDWNPRNEFIRVYDPRGFEFEISLPNLLFILQECTSTKGKGLEGSFVYSWAGSDLVLLPTSSQEYKKNVEFTNMQSKKISTNQLIVGCVYRTNKNEEVVYLGKENVYKWKDISDELNQKKQYSWEGTRKKESTKNHIFQYLNAKENASFYSKYIVLTSLQRIKEQITEIPIENFATIFSQFKDHFKAFNATQYRIIKPPQDVFKERCDNLVKEEKEGLIGEYSWYPASSTLKLCKHIYITSEGQKIERFYPRTILHFNLEEYGILEIQTPSGKYKEYDDYDFYGY